jgi:hypothetical protein
MYTSNTGAGSSASRDAAVEVPHFLSKYDPAALRYYLTAVDNLKMILRAPAAAHGAAVARVPGLRRAALRQAQDRLFGTQQVVEYQEEARLGGVRSHAALTYDHSGAIATWTKRQLPPSQALL